MAKKPKVSPEEFKEQTDTLYAQIGKIVVHAEHLNFAMQICCGTILERQGLPQQYANTMTVGHNVESMRKLWTALTKQWLQDQDDKNGLHMVEQISKRIDKVNGKRNEVVHRHWYIGWGNEKTEAFNVATGAKNMRDFKKGGTKFNTVDTTFFEETITELQQLQVLVFRCLGCVIRLSRSSPKEKPEGRFEDNFYYEDNLLMPGKKTTS